jgi:hypothetical protein
MSNFTATLFFLLLFPSLGKKSFVPEHGVRMFEERATKTVDFSRHVFVMHDKKKRWMSQTAHPALLGYHS